MYVATPMSPTVVKSTIDRLHHSWMARHTRTPHEVSGLQQWVVYYLDPTKGETEMATGDRAIVNHRGDEVHVGRSASCWTTIPIDQVLEVHIKPCA